MPTELAIDADLLSSTDKDDFRHRLAARALAKLTGVGASYSSEVLADQPSGYWRLGEASGTIAADGSGNGNGGTYVNGPTLGTAGLILGDADTAATFDGADDYVQINGLLGTFGSNVLTSTAECWVKTTTTDTGPVVTLYGTNGATGFEISVNRDADYGPSVGDTLYMVQDEAGLTAAGFQISEAIYDGAPHHLVFQLTDPTVPSAAAWVDGVSVAVTPSASNVALGAVADFNNPSNNRFGTNMSLVDFYTGTLDEVAVYPTRLSGARVLAHYEAGTTRPFPTAEELATDATVITDLQTQLADAKSLIDSLAEIAP